MTEKGKERKREGRCVGERGSEREKEKGDELVKITTTGTVGKRERRDA